jgi:hypothetical protein
MATRGPLDLWNEWAPQILVILSLVLQVFLLVFAGSRRREASAVPRILLWQAYLLADSTAIYAVGHFSLSSRSRKHELVAFWAPFLLLHLGGPDNITAYALEDSKLWLRHLQTLVVQVLGAMYVAGSDAYLLLSSVVIFLVGGATWSTSEAPSRNHRWPCITICTLWIKGCAATTTMETNIMFVEPTPCSTYASTRWSTLGSRRILITGSLRC